MIVRCEECQKHFDDEFRSTICPHDTFLANDGANNHQHHPDSYLEGLTPRGWTTPSLKEI